MNNLELNKRTIKKKSENQEKILRIVQRYFVTGKKEEIIKKIS